MPSVSSTTTPPDAPEIAPCPASSSAPSPSSSPAAPAPQPSRLRTYAHQGWRAARAWLAPAPAATTCAALTLIIGIVLLPWGPQGQIALSAYIHRPQRVWTLLTAWAVPGHLLPLSGSLMLLSIGVLLERLLGTRRWLATAAVSSAGGTPGRPTSSTPRSRASACPPPAWWRPPPASCARPGGVARVWRCSPSSSSRPR